MVDTSYDEQIVLNEFVDFLESLHVKYLELLPDFINEGIEKLENMIKFMKFDKQKAELCALLNHLKSYLKLRIFAFNGGELNPSFFT